MVLRGHARGRSPDEKKTTPALLRAKKGKEGTSTSRGCGADEKRDSFFA